jgi:ABC-2 type transport system permease protein
MSENGTEARDTDGAGEDDTDRPSASGDEQDQSDIEMLDERLREQFTWYVVAKKEFQDTRRSKVIWLLSAIFVVIFALPAFLGLYFNIGQLAQQQGQTVTTDAFFAIATRFGSALIPIIAIVIGYAAVVGERESGSLKVLLSLPFTRRDVILGKVVGRSAVVAVPILLGFLVSVLVLIPASVQVSPLGFIAGAGLTALLGVVFVALAVGFSAAVRTSRRAIVGTIGVYIYFFLFWNAFANSVGWALREYLGATAASTLKISLLLKLLNPTQSYQTLVNSALGQSAMSARAGMYQGFQAFGVCQQALGGNASMSQAGAVACTPENGGLPFYFSDPAVVVYFLLWLVVPLVVGYYLFEGTDL